MKTTRSIAAAAVFFQSLAMSNALAGSLIYLDKKGEKLAYKSDSGKIKYIFDQDLTFYYSANDAGDISPNGAYSIVQFSESWQGTDEQGENPLSQEKYLCAFVRMKDGCVTGVGSGDECDGEWTESDRWKSTTGENPRALMERSPDIEKVYNNYKLGLDDLNKTSSPRLLSYLPEGTSVENLAVCNPRNESNEKVYRQMMTLLMQDNDLCSHSRLSKLFSDQRNESYP